MAKIVDVIALAGQGTGSQVVSIGVVLDSGRIGWGDCVDSMRKAEELVEVIEGAVKPLLVGRALVEFRNLSAEIDALTETATFQEVVQHPPPPKAEGVSRREMMRGKLFADDPVAPPPEVREYEVIRPIFGSVRHGASQALLSAFAQSENVPIIEFVRKEFQFERPEAVVPTMAMLKLRQLNAAGRLFGYKIGALALAVDEDNFDVKTGKNGAIIQNAVRRLKSEVKKFAPPQEYSPNFYLRAGGGYGVQQDNKIGQILGQLYGLFAASKPYVVMVEDALIGDDFETHLKLLAELKDYLRMRKTNVLSVARAYVDSVEAVEALIAANAVHAVYLDPQQMGGIDAMIAAAKVCRAADLQVIWGGDASETALAAEITAHIAMAVQPDLVVAKPATQVGIGTMRNEMGRLLKLAEIGSQQ